MTLLSTVPLDARYSAMPAIAEIFPYLANLVGDTPTTANSRINSLPGSTVTTPGPSTPRSFQPSTQRYPRRTSTGPWKSRPRQNDHARSPLHRHPPHYCRYRVLIRVCLCFFAYSQCFYQEPPGFPVTATTPPRTPLGDLDNIDHSPNAIEFEVTQTMTSPTISHRTPQGHAIPPTPPPSSPTLLLVKSRSGPHHRQVK